MAGPTDGSATIAGAYTENGETRTVPLSDDLAAALKEVKEAQEPTAADPVFTKSNGEPWRSWRTAFQNALERATIKDFR